MIDVSVIIPVYNTAPYLKTCLNSILNQTLTNIEIICIDDGSTDQSLMILKYYAKIDSRIKILVQKNQGAGAARNYGMKVAHGRYLSFLDSDDFFHPNLLKKSVFLADKTKADIVIYKINMFDNKKKNAIHASGLFVNIIMSKRYLIIKIILHAYLILFKIGHGINCLEELLLIRIILYSKKY